jgi:hypothetical protein
LKSGDVDFLTLAWLNLQEKHAARGTALGAADWAQLHMARIGQWSGARSEVVVAAGYIAGAVERSLGQQTEAEVRPQS